MKPISKIHQLIAPLPKQFAPVVVSLAITKDMNELINTAKRELQTFAEKDPNKCWGYFPALKEKNNGLTAAKAFHEALPVVDQAGKKLSLNFIRTSLIQQTGSSPFHMDSDSRTALTGNVATINSRLVWRLLVNLSNTHPRTLGYLDIDTAKVELTTNGGYIHFTGKTDTYEKSIKLPSRTKEKMYGVLFCASRVLHTGKDDTNGHFVAGYGCEEVV